MGDLGCSETRVPPNPVVDLHVPYLYLIVDHQLSIFS